MTLVEILICLAIIAVLCVLLYPTASALSRRGKDAKCLANHRSIIQATLAYTAEHGGVLPGNATNNFTHQKLSPYLNIVWSRNAKWIALWYCPARSSGFDTYLVPNYAFTYYSFGLRNMMLAEPPPHPAGFPKNLSEIDYPSKSAALACVLGNYVLYHEYAYTHRTDPPNTASDLANLAPWHRGGTIITFLDGHSKLGEAFPKDDVRRAWFSSDPSKAP